MRCRARNTGRVYESDFVHLVVCREGKEAVDRGARLVGAQSKLLHSLRGPHR